MRGWFVALAGLVCFAAPAPGAPAPPVHWRIAASPRAAVKPGGKFEVTVAGAIDPGWHLYALDEPAGGPIATEVSLAEGDPAEVLRVTGSKPIVARDASFGMETGMFENSAVFTLHLRASPEGGAAGAIRVLIRYQACNTQVCLPPRTDTIPVSFAAAR